MVKNTIVLTNKSGLHARPASIFVNAAKNFTSKISIEKDNVEIDGKSILGLLTLGAAKGTEISIIAEGEDEEKAVEELIQLIKSGFGE